MDRSGILQAICDNLKAKANAGQLTLRDEAAAMDPMMWEQSELWVIASACLPDDVMIDEKGDNQQGQQ